MSQRILIVDNEPGVIYFLAENLADLGPDYEIETCQSGEEALVQATIKRFDLVITDFRMPGINGLQLIRFLRDQQPRIKLILMTAYGDQSVALMARQLQLNGYITKPFEMEEMLTTVKTVLANHYPQKNQMLKI